MSVSPPRLPMGVPPSVVQGLLAQMLQGRHGPGPLPPQAPPPSNQPGPAGAAPAAAPQGQPQAPPPGTPAQQGGGKDRSEGIPPDLQKMLEGLMEDPKARKDIQKILQQAGGNQRASSPLKIDPTVRLQLAQGWNARVDAMGREIANQRGVAPGASKASDEALLTIYYATPMDPNAPDPVNDPQPIRLEDIDDYADAVRAYLVTQEGFTDPDKVEDQTMRMCFPLRETLIRSGRRTWRERIEFVREMQALTERWLKRYGRLPKPDIRVLKATEQGKGDPESQPRDSDSEAMPAA